MWALEDRQAWCLGFARYSCIACRSKKYIMLMRTSKIFPELNVCSLQKVSMYRFLQRPLKDFNKVKGPPQLSAYFLIPFLVK
jgi:hypothetical protein